jgi:hypothetical protein
MRASRAVNGEQRPQSGQCLVKSGCGRAVEGGRGWKPLPRKSGGSCQRFTARKRIRPHGSGGRPSQEAGRVSGGPKTEVPG